LYTTLHGFHETQNLNYQPEISFINITELEILLWGEVGITGVIFILDVKNTVTTFWPFCFCYVSRCIVKTIL